MTSIALTNRVRELEINVDQLKDMVATLYMQLKELTDKLAEQQPPIKAQKRNGT
jgi:predicted ATP-grasp superfamily ATP-dependent carboligase